MTSRSLLSVLVLGASAVLAACGGTEAPIAPQDAGGDADHAGLPDGGADAPTRDAPSGDAQPPPPPAPADKLDLLFMIDNSASMADKQGLLRQAVPDLLSRLVNPNCLDASGAPMGPSNGGVCPAGQTPEFKPVTDMHVGIVSSSLGGRGSDACPADAKNPSNPQLSAHDDDQGHLLNRAGDDEHALTDAQPSNFLAWFPPVDANKGKPAPPVPALSDPSKLLSDFQDLVSGVHEHGCGYEAQLESWYRFLVQPDPYASIVKNGNIASLQGVDATVLQQRHDFLRPDSALAVVMLTDENEETADPLALAGQGWAFENSTFPGAPQGSGAPKGTSVCATNPLDPGCTSCLFKPNDPGCSPPYYGAVDDQLGVRFFHMKARFGLEPQLPIARYVRGLTQAKVPNRDGEHANNASDYTGEQHADCTNPIFASALPADPNAELCHLPAGTRDPRQVFLLVIGGVPHQLLQIDRNDPNSPQKPALTDGDWMTILGKDPLAYDFSGVDPHMLESIVPREGLPPPTASDTADPINGREWDTQGGDLQYACVFDLPAPKDCTLAENAGACDCDGFYSGPLCQSKGSKIQIRGKAYPTIRELALARAMGGQAFVSSLCPIHVTEAAAGDPLYGYRPAMNGLIDRLKGALAR